MTGEDRVSRLVGSKSETTRFHIRSTTTPTPSSLRAPIRSMTTLTPKTSGSVVRNAPYNSIDSNTGYPMLYNSGESSTRWDTWNLEGRRTGGSGNVPSRFRLASHTGLDTSTSQLFSSAYDFNTDIADTDQAQGQDEPPLDPDQQRYVYCAYLLGFISTCNSIDSSVVTPSLLLYCKSIDEENATVMYGNVLMVFFVSSMLLKTPLGWWCDSFGFRVVYCITICLAAVGNLLYASGAYLQAAWPLYVGRALCGAADANSGLAYAYIARAIPPSHQAKIVVMLGLTFPLGLMLGPSLNAITAVMNFSIGPIPVNANNAPGVLLAVIFFLTYLVTLVFLKEAPVYAGRASRDPRALTWYKKVYTIWMDMRRPAVLMCFLLVFVFNFVTMAYPAAFYLVSDGVFHLTPFQNSLISMGVAFEVITLTVVVRWVIARLSKVVILVFAVILYIVSLLVSALLWNQQMSMTQFLLGYYSAQLALPFVFAPNRALFAELITSSPNQASLSSLLSLVSSSGAALGSKYCTWTWAISASGALGSTMFIGLFVACGFLLLMAWLVWFSIDPPANTAQSPWSDYRGASVSRSTVTSQATSGLLNDSANDKVPPLPTLRSQSF